MELNREQIVKALACCENQGVECRKCPLIHTKARCYSEIKKLALSLINELTAENESLKKNIETYMGRLKSREKQFCDLNKINTLLIENKYGIESEAYISIVGKERKLEYRIKFDPEFDLIAKEKAETVQKYRECLYRELASLGAKDKFNKEFFLTKVDKVAKEMLDECKK